MCAQIKMLIYIVLCANVCQQHSLSYTNTYSERDNFQPILVCIGLGENISRRYQCKLTGLRWRCGTVRSIYLFYLLTLTTITVTLISLEKIEIFDLKC